MNLGEDSLARTMADSLEAESDLFLESYWTSPGTRKRKKKSKKNKKAKKSKCDTALTKIDGIQHKKKNPKFKEAVKERKEEKKKKKRMVLGIDDGFIFTQACAAFDPLAQWMSPGQIPATTSVVSTQQSPQQPTTDQVTSEAMPQKKKRKKIKSKKKVKFELSPCYNCVQVQSTVTPKVILPFTQSAPAKDVSALQNQGVGDHETLSQATEIEKCSGQMQDNESQCTGEDSYSQDLFITQKTFRPPSSLEPSSGENTNGEEGAITTQQDTKSCKNVLPRQKQGAELTQQVEEQNTSPTQHQTDSHAHLRDPQGEACNKQTHFPQQCRKANPYLQEPMETHSRLAEESKGSRTPHSKPKKTNSNLQEPTDLIEESKESHSAHLKRKKAKLAKPYLEQPVEVNALSDTTKPPKEESCTQWLKATRPTCGLRTSKLPSLFSLRLTTDTSTQTDNLFTTKLSSYLTFHQQSRAAVSSADLEPLDLSLPQRARAELCRILSCLAKSPVVEEDRDEGGKPGEQHPSSFPIIITDDDGGPSQQLLSSSGVKIKKESDGQRPLSSTPNVRGEATPSLQKEAETKSTDTTSSSEDSELGVRNGKLDLIQVRSVQTRLNESFFFKVKGDDPSPRPESPLMKLAQGREMISKKSH